MMNNPELLDVVELLVNLPDEGLQVGHRGRSWRVVGRMSMRWSL